MAYFNEENTVEQMLINAAAQRGWIYVEPKFVPRLPDEVLVVEWLLEALLRLNPITPEQIEARDPVIFSKNNVVCVSDRTHRFIHYGGIRNAIFPVLNRTPNDTCPWKRPKGGDR